MTQVNVHDLVKGLEDFATLPRNSPWHLNYYNADTDDFIDVVCTARQVVERLLCLPIGMQTDIMFAIGNLLPEVGDSLQLLGKDGQIAAYVTRIKPLDGGNPHNIRLQISK